MPWSCTTSEVDMSLACRCELTEEIMSNEEWGMKGGKRL